MIKLTEENVGYYYDMLINYFNEHTDLLVNEDVEDAIYEYLKRHIDSSYEYSEFIDNVIEYLKAWDYWVEKQSESIKIRKNNDKMLLESLVKKYGKNGVRNAIKTITEDTDENTILDRLTSKDPEPEITAGLTDKQLQYFKEDVYEALNTVANKWEFRYNCPSDDDWFNTLKWFLKEFRNRNF